MSAKLYQGAADHAAWCKAYVEDNHMLLAQQPYTPPAFNRYSVNMPGTHGGVKHSVGQKLTELREEARLQSYSPE